MGAVAERLAWNQLQNLRHFVEASNHASLSAASRSTRRATSAVARSVRMLEDALGTELVERSTRGIVLTRGGRLARERGLRIVGEIEAMARHGRNIEGGHHANLRNLTHLFGNGRKLELLIDLDATRSVGRTAENLGLSQSAASMALGSIESALGKPLYRRLRRGLDPEPHGALLLRHAKRVSAELRHLTSEIASLAEGISGTVVVGLLSMARTQLFPAAVASVLTAHPQLRIKALDWPFDPLVEGLRSGDVDFTIGVVRDGSEHAGLVAEPLMSDDLRLLVRADDPLLRESRVGLANLSGKRWILPRPDSRGARSIREGFTARGLTPPEPSVETSDLQLIRQLLLSTDMIAVASPNQLAFELAAGKVRELPIELAAARRDIALLSREGAHLPPAALAVMDEIRRAAQAMAN